MGYYGDDGQYYDNDGVPTHDPAIPMEVAEEDDPEWPSYHWDTLVPLRAITQREKKNSDKRITPAVLEDLWNVLDGIVAELSRTAYGTQYNQNGEPIDFKSRGRLE